MWIKKDDYYLQNDKSTICKINPISNPTYELWHQGTQYAGFLTADEAKLKHESLTK